MISEHVDAQPSRQSESFAYQAENGSQRGSGAGWVIAVIVLLAVCVGGFFGVRWLMNRNAQAGSAAAAGGQRTVPVLAATAHQGDLDLYLNGLGTVTAFNTVTIKSRVDGQIEKVLFSEGQMVNKDDPLIEIDPRPFEVQLTQAQGQLTKDQASLKNAQLDLDRYLSIHDSVTQQQVDTQKAMVQQFQGAVTSDQGQIDNAKLQIAYCHIAAPISGRIGLRLVDEGNIVHANDPNGVAVVTQLQPIAVVFTVPEDQITQVFTRPDHGQGLPVDAYNRDLQTKLASGSVLAIDNQVDPTTGTVRIKAEFENKDDALFPNQFVNARLLVNTVRGAVIVPAAAVQRGPDTLFVYIVKGDHVELHNVTLGPSEGDRTIIESGVSVGDVVVTDGVDKLQQGTKVAVRQAPASAMRGTTRPTATTRTTSTTRPFAGTQPAGTTFPSAMPPPSEGRGGRRGSR